MAMCKYSEMCLIKFHSHAQGLASSMKSIFAVTNTFRVVVDHSIAPFWWIVVSIILTRQIVKELHNCLYNLTTDLLLELLYYN